MLQDLSINIEIAGGNLVIVVNHLYNGQQYTISSKSMIGKPVHRNMYVFLHHSEIDYFNRSIA